MRCARPLICAATASFLAVACPLSVSAASSPVTYTLSYAETAALLGFTQMDTLQTANMSFRQDIPQLDGSTAIRYCPYSWQANYTINGNPYIGIRVYGDRSAWLSNTGQLDVVMFMKFTLDDLYSFTVDVGFLGADAAGDYTKSQAGFTYYTSGVETHVSKQVTKVSSAVNADTGSSTDFATICQTPLYPPGATAPIYDFYYINGGPTPVSASFYGVRNISATLEFDGVTYTGYTYVYFRCPTITTDSDTMDLIAEKLDTITSSMTPSDGALSSASAALSDAQDAAQSAQSALSGIDDFVVDHSFTVPSSPVYPTDGLRFLTILMDFWQQHELVVTVTISAMAFAAVSYVLYGKKI